MIQPTAVMLLLVCCVRRYGCSGYGGQPHYTERNRYSPYQRYSQQPIKHRYHPTTYSKESSEEETPAANMPAPQVVPDIQYAYQGGVPQSDYLDQDVPVHQGEVLNHVRQQPSPSITPRPHPVYQQMKPKPQQALSLPQQAASPNQESHLQSVPPEVLSSALHNLQDVVYYPHHEYDHGYPDHGYPEHHEVAYHYDRPVPPPRPPPPPQKSKATRSAFAYYYIGRHLWYVPLYFSIYFIAYVGLLVLKSIARHKVLLPQLSEEAAAAAAVGNRRQIYDNYALRSIEEGKQKYYMR